jgi:hypothetical protein
MNRQLLSIGFAAATAFCGEAIAQQAQFVQSLGELSSVFSCFYECKPGPLVNNVATWQEVTTLKLANQSNRFMVASILLLDGNQRIRARTATSLSGEDLDEVNVCRTLQQGGIVPPEQGLIEVLLTAQPLPPLPPGGSVPDVQPEFGSYGWMKNLLGKFFVTENEPFRGRVIGIAKAECRLAPLSVTSIPIILSKVITQQPPEVQAILIEGTADE